MVKILLMKHTIRNIGWKTVEDCGIDTGQFIYMEREYHPVLNGFIMGSLAFIEDEFSFRSLRFVYLPEMAKAIAGQEYLDYIVPTGERRELFTTADAFEILFGGVEDMPCRPFLMCCSGNGAGARLEIWEFESDDSKSIRNEFLQFIVQLDDAKEGEGARSIFSLDEIKVERHHDVECTQIPKFDCIKESNAECRVESPLPSIDERKPVCSSPERETEENDEKKRAGGKMFGMFVPQKTFYLDAESDEGDICVEKELSFDSIPATLPIKVQWETNVKNVGADALFNDIMASDQYIEATNKIYEGIKQLHKLGIGNLVIRSIAGPGNLLSRMHIDDDYNITLPDYNNMTIDMAPMTKALYLLFLRHEEGIAFKDLPDYRRELIALYWDLIESDDEETVLATVERVTDPFNNDINVHCSRIKAAFTLKFENALASNYYIYGKRGEAKRISLPRELVEWC